MEGGGVLGGAFPARAQPGPGSGLSAPTRLAPHGHGRPGGAAFRARLSGADPFCRRSRDLRHAGGAGALSPASAARLSRPRRNACRHRGPARLTEKRRLPAVSRRFRAVHRRRRASYRSHPSRRYFPLPPPCSHFRPALTNAFYFSK